MIRPLGGCIEPESLVAGDDAGLRGVRASVALDDVATLRPGGRGLGIDGRFWLLHSVSV